MKRDEKFELINELSMAVTEQTVYDKVLNKGRVEYLANTNTLKINTHYKEPEQEKTIKHWVGECAKLQQKLDMSNEKIVELQEDMEFFNSLPWYERMFHKFDV